jgi:hypothetical protein
MKGRLRRTLWALTGASLLSGCGEPKYPAWEVTLDEAPGVVYRFSAADATRASPVFMSVQGREPTPEDIKLRTRLIRRWTAAHAPQGATFAYWGSSMCGLQRKGEFPGCDIFAINIPATRDAVPLYFYAGNWYRP